MAGEAEGVVRRRVGGVELGRVLGQAEAGVVAPVRLVAGAALLGEHLGGHTFEPQLGEPGYARMLAKGRRPYQTKDGYVCVLVYNDKQWRTFFDLIGRSELLADPRFATQEARSRNYEPVYDLVAEEMKGRTTAEWIAALEGADIPVQRMNSLADVIADPHLAATGFFGTVEHPSEGRLKSMAAPIEWSETASGYRRRDLIPEPLIASRCLPGLPRENGSRLSYEYRLLDILLSASMPPFRRSWLN